MQESITMNLKHVSKWGTHHLFSACKVRYLTDNDRVLDELKECYSGAIQALAPRIKAVEPEMPVFASLFPPIMSEDGEWMRSALFVYWKERAGLSQEESGYALLEVLHPATERGILEAGLILFPAFSELQGNKVTGGPAK